jgi:hypothetical protein
MHFDKLGMNDSIEITSKKFITRTFLLLFFVIAILGIFFVYYFGFSINHYYIKFFEFFEKSQVIKSQYISFLSYPIILAILTFLAGYIYLFFRIKRQGFSIYEEKESVQYAVYSFISKVVFGIGIIIFFILYLIQKGETSQIILVLLFISGYIIIRSMILSKYKIILKNYENLKGYIEFMNNSSPMIFRIVFNQFHLIMDVILLFTFLTAILCILENFNLFTLLIFEFILLEIYVLISLFNKIPKETSIIQLTNNVLNNVFILYDSPRNFLLILNDENKRMKICKNQIIKILKFE